MGTASHLVGDGHLDDQAARQLDQVAVGAAAAQRRADEMERDLGPAEPHQQPHTAAPVDCPYRGTTCRESARGSVVPVPRPQHHTGIRAR